MMGARGYLATDAGAVMVACDRHSQDKRVQSRAACGCPSKRARGNRTEDVMSERETLLALAARCEAATGADRALDFMILKRVCGLRDLGHGLYEMGGWYHSLDNDDPSEKHPPFPSPTASVDAAMTLVPEGWGWQMRRGHSGGGRAVCYLWDGTGTRSPSVVAATPALALCAAALRAKAEVAS